MKKSFSILRLKVGETPFTMNDFSSIPEESVDNLKVNNEIQHNKIIKKKLLENRFISIYFEEGSVNPRPEVVYDTSNKEDTENPRSNHEIERNSQTFILIDSRDQKIFISDFRKKKTIEDWLSEKIGQTVLIKDIIDKESFLNEIQSLNTLYLSAIPNLFASTGILSKEITNDQHNYGVGIKHIGVKIQFEENSLPEVLKNKILSLFQQQDNNAIQKLEISGRYDEKFERVFNTEGIIDKIEIDVSSREDGLLDPTDIFENLITKIK